MNTFYRLVLLFAAASFFPACADYQIHVDKEHRDWQSQSLPDKPLDYRVYLIGDAGNSEMGYRTAALHLLKQELESAPANSAVVFLGDNVYHDGLPAKDQPGRELAEFRLKTQLDILKDYPGEIIFLSGNHDWRVDGIDGVRRQEEYIEDYLDRGNVYFPDNGCSGPVSKELTDKLGVIIVDSQWYLINWDEEPELNEECEIRTREHFELELKDEARDFRGKNLLVLAHHPLISNGWHGGNYSWKEHLFPLTLTHPPIYMPLPGIGTIAVWISGAIATRQEIAHPTYRRFIDAVEGALDMHGNTVYAAGHEHNLQLSVDEGDDESFVHIVSGAGSKKSPVRMSRQTPFVYGGSGFSVINYYDDGEAWVEFIRPKEEVDQIKIEGRTHPVQAVEVAIKEEPLDGLKGEKKSVSEVKLSPQVIFRRKIKEPLPTVEELTPEEFPEYEKGKDSVTISILEKGEIWDLNNFLWGKLWSDYYFMDLKMPVLNLDEYVEGGLTAFKRGGGFQTKSVRLVNEDESRVWQLRGLRKSAEKLFYPLNKTFAKNVLEYYFTAGNPFGAFILGPMQDSIGMFHSNPSLVYVPLQPRLNRYNEYGGGVFMIEERPDEDWSDLYSYGYSKEIESTSKVIEERMESDDAVIDQPMMLRSRLFDMIIGDWDRHEDQWRWATTPIEGTDRILYQPIPRDRDQAFAKYEGLVYHIARVMVPYFRATHPFDGEIGRRETKWLNFQARNVDRFFLNELGWKDWEEQTRLIQENLTDEVIGQSIKWLPDTVFVKMGPTLIENIKSRRDALMETSRRYYEILNKKVNVIATQKENLIKVERLNDLETKVTILELEDDGPDELIYERVFDNKVTKEIRIYGLEGDDRFEVTGNVKDSPLIRLIGGIDEDTFVDRSSVKGRKKLTIIYDDLEEDNEVETGTEARDERSVVSDFNRYVFRENWLNNTLFFPGFGFNPDDGIYFGGTINVNRYGFKKMNEHRLTGIFTAATQGISLNYVGIFNMIWDRKDLYIEASAEAPRYVDNFFGLGNETTRIEDVDRNFYRIKRQRFSLFPAIKNRSEGGVFFAFGPLIDVVKINRDPGTFLSGDIPGIRSDVFGYQYFAGGKVDFNYNNIDNPWFPERGVNFNAGTSWRSNVQENGRNFFNVSTDLTAHVPLDMNFNFILSSRIGYSRNIGEFDFFHGVTLGGDDNLRGYASERFTGRGVFFHNTEFRMKLLDRDFTHLPMSFGISPAFDYGRVWADGENSSKWHYGYGGKIWAAPLDYIGIALGLMRSEEGERITVTMGFDF